MTDAEAFDRALTAKDLNLDGKDKAAALAVFAYLERCRALVRDHAPR